MISKHHCRVTGLPYRYNTFVWNAVLDFVEKICKETDRDETHGLDHMKKVAETSLEIYRTTEMDPSLYVPIVIVAGMHDVADKKYDHDKTLKPRLHNQIIKLVGENEAQLIMLTIDLISFSCENNAIKAGTPIDFEKVLGPKYAIVRNIVSDADKLEAIGKEGIDRCRKYTKRNYFLNHKEKIPNDILHREIKKHAEEKLLLLKDNFMRTEHGKKLAEPLHAEMAEYLKRF